jgi:hypothetical protein
MVVGHGDGPAQPTCTAEGTTANGKISRQFQTARRSRTEQSRGAYSREIYQLDRPRLVKQAGRETRNGTGSKREKW